MRPPVPGVLTAATAPGQPTFDGGTNVYLPDIASARSGAGMYRLTFDPVTETITGSVGIAVGDPALAANKPVGSALGPDGKLYVSFLTDGTVLRITTPGAATQTVEAVGSEAGGRISYLAFVGADLYVAGAITPGRITGAAACAGACLAQSIAPTVTAPLSLALDPGTTFLYIGNASGVWRFDTTGALPTVLFANGGTAGPAILPFQNVSGLGFDNVHNLFAGDDPTAGLGVGQGRLWEILAGQAPGAVATGMVVGSLATGGVTVPEGTVFLPGALGGHLWISDHLQGLCRLDPGLTPGSLVINAGTCIGVLNGGPTAAGQPSFDPLNNFVYLPDIAAARTGAGMFRLTFDPLTETVTDPVAIAVGSTDLDTNKPVGSALGPDGKLYVSFLKDGTIKRIPAPNVGSAQVLEPVGNEPAGPGGRGSSLAFVGPALYVAGSVRLGVINAAAACTGACLATAKAPLISAPLAVAYDGSRFLYVGDVGGVWRYNPATGVAELYSNTGTNGVVSTPYSNVSGLGFDPQGILYGGDDPTAGLTPLQGRLWTIQPYMISIHEANSGHAGTLVNYTVTVKNTSGVADTFNLSYSGNTWATVGPASVGPLAIDAIQDITVQTVVPPGLAPLTDTVTVTATAASSPPTSPKDTIATFTTTKILYPINLPLIHN